MLLELPLRLLIALLLTLALAGCDRQKPEAPQGEAAEAGAVFSGKIDRSHAGEAAPDTAFLDPDGESVTLTDFEGAPLLVNLWATWCAPCVAEMPTLDALAEGSDLQVLAISEDFADQAPKVDAFFEERGLDALLPYRDPELGLMTTLAIGTLPTTILYDSSGREVWRVTGALDWAGPEASALIAEAR